jgi:hypothetical protein
LLVCLLLNLILGFHNHVLKIIWIFLRTLMTFVLHFKFNFFCNSLARVSFVALSSFAHVLSSRSNCQVLCYSHWFLFI